MGSRKVTGGSGAELFVSECGNSDGHAILFVHGYGQSHLAWIRQMQSPELTSRYRLVALDLVGTLLSSIHSHIDRCFSARARCI